MVTYDFVVCPRCARHVKRNDPACPFCRSALAEQTSRTALAAAVLVGIGVSLGACAKVEDRGSGGSAFTTSTSATAGGGGVGNMGGVYGAPAGGSAGMGGLGGAGGGVGGTTPQGGAGGTGG